MVSDGSSKDRNCRATGFLCATLALSFVADAFAQAMQGKGPIVRMGLCRQAPVIDGVISDEEWADALVMAGTACSRYSNLEQRRGWAYFAFDAKRLYFGIKTETQPGGRLYYWPHRPDLFTGRADGIELWIAPLPSPKEPPADRFQLWYDPGGAFWGMIHRYGTGVQFKGTCEYKNTIANDYWTLEAAIPWGEVGVKEEAVKPGLHFLIRPTRNWRYPHNYASWGYPKAFVDPASMVRVIVDDRVPIVKATTLGDILHGKPDVKLKLVNPTKAAIPLDVRIQLGDVKQGKLVAEKHEALSLAAGQAKDIQFAEPFTLTHNYLNIVVTRTSDNAICYERAINLGRPRENAWSPIPPRNVKLRGGYYPYYHKAKATIDLGDLPQAKEVTRVAVALTPAESARTLAKGDITEFDYNTGSVILDTPDLSEGEYLIKAEVFAGGKKLTLDPIPQRKFVRIKLPWERNTIGITDKVYPPFTPITVKGAYVNCVGRSHEINGLGLWSQVSSMGCELLTRSPMHFECRQNGRLLAWKTLHPMEVKYLKKESNQVVHRGHGACEALAVTTTSTWDYDGAMKVEMELEPRGTGLVDDLTMVIPLERSEASLYHATTFIRGNPVGALPEGEGVIWDSRSLVQTIGLGSFTPYIWVGGPERGICWFADSDRGWITDDEKAAFEIVRKGEEVQLRVNFINRPGKVTGKRRIVFAIMATPAKPQPAGWRGWARGYSPASRPLVYSLASLRFAGLSNCESLDPLGGDWSVVRELAKAKRTGKTDSAWIEKWLERHGAEKDKRQRSMIKNLFGRAASSRGAEMVLYTNPALEGGRTPQIRTFRQEWRGGSGGTRITPSYADYAVWCFDQFLENGLDGLYQDNTFPVVSSDTVAGNAYVRDDGKVQAGWDMFGHREMYKRMFVAGWERTGKCPLLAVHTTNSNNAAYFSFTTISFDLEWEYGTDRTFQEKFDFDLLCTESHGKQAGLVPIILCWMGGPKAKAQKGDSEEVKAEKAKFLNYLERTRVGVCLLHDMMPWGSYRVYGPVYTRLAKLGFQKPDCRMLPYWSNSAVVKTSSDQIKVSLFKQGRTVVAVVCSVGDTGKHRLKLDLQKLRLPETCSAVDVEERPGLTKIGPGEVEFELRRHDFRVIAFVAEGD